MEARVDKEDGLVRFRFDKFDWGNEDKCRAFIDEFKETFSFRTRAFTGNWWRIPILLVPQLRRLLEKHRIEIPTELLS